MKRTLKVSLVASLLVLAGAAQAQQLCLPHEKAVGRLQRYHGESAKGLGLGNRGRSVLELFVSDTGSWTILVTRTNGLSCIAASGENWTPTETEIPQMVPPIADDGSTSSSLNCWPLKKKSHQWDMFFRVLDQPLFRASYLFPRSASVLHGRHIRNPGSGTAQGHSAGRYGARHEKSPPERG